MKITVNFPDRPKGDDVKVAGLGAFANQETHEVSEEQVARATSLGYHIPEDGLYGVPLASPKASPKKAVKAAPTTTEDES